MGQPVFFIQPVPAVMDLGLLGIGAHFPWVKVALCPHVAPAVVGLAPGVDVAVSLSG